MTDLPLIRLQPGRDKRVAAGHPWIFSNEIAMTPELREVPLGAPVRVEAANGKALGVGGFNRHALIAVRMLDRNPDAAIDTAFLRRRLAAAVALRDGLFDRPFYRLIHAEADGLPGLIIDRYGDVLVVQSNTALMDRLEGPLCDALQDLLQPRAIVLRNDSAIRGLEGLAEEVRIARGALDGPVAVEENGAVFEADPLGGQKTGWFFDQRDNRAFVAKLARGRRMIDIYTHTGGFGIQAALAGAEAVTLVDRSAPSLELALKAAAANGVADRVTTARGEAFAEIERRATAGERWDVVVVDPPAFVKSKKDLAAGSRGYAKLARLAARITERGGFLCAFSCSHHVDPVLFAEQVARGLVDAGRMGRILRQSGAGPDHPVHPLLPESGYLKGIVLQLD
jgi:23S rRNA (cytosine1962-C5)-methyltransferase